MRFVACIIVALTLSNDSFAADYGIVTDITGKAVDAGSKKNIVIGQNIQADAKYEISGKATMVVVEYATCSEWTLKGPATVSLSSGEPRVAKRDMNGKVSKSATLGACFNPTDAKSASSHEMGGLVLRGVKTKKKTVDSEKQDGAAPLPPRSEPEAGERAIAEMKKHAAEHNASNSELMMLVLYSKMHDDLAGVREYLGELRNRTPDSPFVKQYD